MSHGHRAARARGHEADRDGSARPAHGRRRHRRGRAGPPPAVGRLRRAGGRRRRRGHGRARARERRAREVRRRLRRRDPPQPRGLPRGDPRCAPHGEHVGRAAPIVSDGVRLPLPIVLIGPMGAGKSRIGQRLAAAARRCRSSTPTRRIARAHGPIAEIFDRAGRGVLPRRRARGRRRGAARATAVVSLGGGAVLAPRHPRRPRRPAPSCWLTRLARGRRAAARRRQPAADRGRRHRRLDGASSTSARADLRASSPTVDIDTSRRSVARIVDEIAERFAGGAR